MKVIWFGFNELRSGHIFRMCICLVAASDRRRVVRNEFNS